MSFLSQVVPVLSRNVTRWALAADKRSKTWGALWHRPCSCW